MQPNLTRRGVIRLGAGAAAAAGLATLAGCTPAHSSVSATNAKLAPSTLRIGTPDWKAATSVDPTTGNTVAGLNSILSQFEKPNNSTVSVINIVADSSNSVIAKTQTLLLGNQVDIVEGATLWPFYQQGLLEDLTPYVKRDNWTANYVKSIFTPPMERFMYPPWAPDPKIYLSVPADVQVPSLAYDKQLFKDFGVEPLSKIPSMKEILEKAPQLTGKNPRTGKQCYAIGYDPGKTAHIMLFYLGRGVDFGAVDPQNPSALKLDTPQTLNEIEQLISIAKYCPPGFEVGQGLENWGTENNTVAMNMVVYTADMLPAIQNGLSSRFVVTDGIRDTSNHTFLITGLEWAMAKSTKNKDAAWELLKFLSGPVTQKLAWQNTLDLPSWKKADWVSTKKLPYEPAFAAVAAAGRNAFFPEYMFTDFRPWITQELSLAIHGKNPNIAAGLKEQQQKGEAWAKTQPMKVGV